MAVEAGLGFLRYATSFLPVLSFLGALVLLDSFKLITLRNVWKSIGFGALAALGAMYFNGAMVTRLDISGTLFTRYFAPLVEECFKMVYLLYVFRKRRIGFLVDAAIYGFAVGAGFALIENAYYLYSLEASSGWVWVVRGFGTAALHGATMVMFAVITKTWADRRGTVGALTLLPGLAVAVSVHSLYNHFVLPPLQSTLLLLIVFPILMVVVFDRSEHITRNWIGDGWQMDVDLLASLSEGELADNPVGTYLDTLRHKFQPHVVADMLCLLGLHVELAMAAKGLLMAREAGIQMPPDPDVHDKLAEVTYLEQSIGRTGLLTLRPFLHGSDQEAWQRQLLGS